MNWYYFAQKNEAGLEGRPAPQKGVEENFMLGNLPFHSTRRLWTGFVSRKLIFIENFTFSLCSLNPLSYRT